MKLFSVVGLMRSAKGDIRYTHSLSPYFTLVGLFSRIVIPVGSEGWYIIVINK